MRHPKNHRMKLTLENWTLDRTWFTWLPYFFKQNRDIITSHSLGFEQQCSENHWNVFRWLYQLYYQRIYYVMLQTFISRIILHCKCKPSNRFCRAEVALIILQANRNSGKGSRSWKANHKNWCSQLNEVKVRNVRRQKMSAKRSETESVQ